MAATATIRVGRRPLRIPPPHVVLAVALLAWGITEAVTLDGEWPLAARVAFAVVALTPVLAIDRRPWAVVAVLLAATAVEFRFDVLGMSVSPMQGIVIAGWVAGSTIDDLRRSLAALAGVTAVALAATLGLSPFGIVLACALGWAGARATRGVRDRRAHAMSVLRTARHTSAELRRSEVDAERRRLARELDVAVLRAARRIGADARRAEELLTDDPDAAKAALRTIAGTVRDAMTQMRQALSVLRPDGDDDGSPQPDGLATAVVALRGRSVPVRLHDHGDDDERATALAAARILEIVVGSAWRPRRVDVRRTGHGARIRLHGRGPVTSDERLALTRCAERARLHSGTVRVRRRPRPWDLRARTATVHVPVLTRDPRRGPGPAGIVAGVLAAAATAVDVLTGHSLPIPPGDEPTAGAIVASSLLTGVAVSAAWTRRTAFLVLLAVVAFVRSRMVNYVGLDATTLPLLALAAFVTPLWLRDARQRSAVAVALAASGVAVIALSWSNAVNVSDVAIMTISLVAPWVIATAVRDAADDASRLTVLRWATARDDLIAAQRAVDDERRRVARDLHDLVGHGLSLVSVQAWGAERALPRDVDRARQGIAAIRRVVSSAVGELERLVIPWDDEPDDLVDVIEEARRSGLPVTVDVGGTPGVVGRAPGVVGGTPGVVGGAPGVVGGAPGVVGGAPGVHGAIAAWPPDVATALRRVVQESLTNVVRHAGPVPTTVRLQAVDGLIELEIVNRLGRPVVAPGPSGGLGLTGMRERIEGLGGTFVAGEDAGRFVVRVTLAYPAAVGDVA